jgi:hypothetical protein
MDCLLRALVVMFPDDDWKRYSEILDYLGDERGDKETY